MSEDKKNTTWTIASGQMKFFGGRISWGSMVLPVLHQGSKLFALELRSLVPIHLTERKLLGGRITSSRVFAEGKATPKNYPSYK